MHKRDFARINMPVDSGTLNLVNALPQSRWEQVNKPKEHANDKAV